MDFFFFLKVYKPTTEWIKARAKTILALRTDTYPQHFATRLTPNTAKDTSQGLLLGETRSSLWQLV